MFVYYNCNIYTINFNDSVAHIELNNFSAALSESQLQYVYSEQKIENKRCILFNVLL